VVPDRIAEVNDLHIGGLDPWVMIRGENLANPRLILLHGGPGMSGASTLGRNWRQKLPVTVTGYTVRDFPTRIYGPYCLDSG
jgi:hypothetical protein